MNNGQQIDRSSSHHSDDEDQMMRGTQNQPTEHEHPQIFQQEQNVPLQEGLDSQLFQMIIQGAHNVTIGQSQSNQYRASNQQDFHTQIKKLLQDHDNLEIVTKYILNEIEIQKLNVDDEHRQRNHLQTTHQDTVQQVEPQIQRAQKLSFVGDQHQNNSENHDSLISSNGFLKPILFQDFDKAQHSLNKKRKDREKKASQQGRSIMPEINKSLLFNNKIEMIQKDNEIRLIDTQEFNVTDINEPGQTIPQSVCTYILDVLRDEILKNPETTYFKQSLNSQQHTARLQELLNSDQPQNKMAEIVSYMNPESLREIYNQYRKISKKVLDQCQQIIEKSIASSIERLSTRNEQAPTDVRTNPHSLGLQQSYQRMPPQIDNQQQQNQNYQPKNKKLQNGKQDRELQKTGKNNKKCRGNSRVVFDSEELNSDNKHMRDRSKFDQVRMQQVAQWERQSRQTSPDHLLSFSSNEKIDDHPQLESNNHDLVDIFKGFELSNHMRPKITLPLFEEKNSDDEEFDIMKDYMQCMGRKIRGIQGQDDECDGSNIQQIVRSQVQNQNISSKRYHQFLANSLRMCSSNKLERQDATNQKQISILSYFLHEYETMDHSQYSDEIFGQIQQLVTNSHVNEKLQNLYLLQMVINKLKENPAKQVQVDKLQQLLYLVQQQSENEQKPTVTNDTNDDLPKLPVFFQSLEMINLRQKKKPWHTYKRGRKRHGLYRKQIWCKKAPKNTYEPRIVPKFQFDTYKKKITKFQPVLLFQVMRQHKNQKLEQGNHFPPEDQKVEVQDSRSEVSHSQEMEDSQGQRGTIYTPPDGS